VRLAVVAHPDRHLPARFQAPRQVDRQAALGIAPARRRQRLAVDLDGVDRQVAVEVEVDALERRPGAEGQQGIAADAAAGGFHAQLQVGFVEVEGQLVGIAGGAGVDGEVGEGRLRGAGGQERAGEGGGGFFHPRNLSRRTRAAKLPVTEYLGPGRIYS
jgi:hypothetical protein